MPLLLVHASTRCQLDRPSSKLGACSPLIAARDPHANIRSQSSVARADKGGVGAQEKLANRTIPAGTALRYTVDGVGGAQALLGHSFRGIGLDAMATHSPMTVLACRLGSSGSRVRSLRG